MYVKGEISQLMLGMGHMHVKDEISRPWAGPLPGPGPGTISGPRPGAKWIQLGEWARDQV